MNKQKHSFGIPVGGFKRWNEAIDGFGVKKHIKLRPSDFHTRIEFLKWYKWWYEQQVHLIELEIEKMEGKQQ